MRFISIVGCAALLNHARMGVAASRVLRWTGLVLLAVLGMVGGTRREAAGDPDQADAVAIRARAAFRAACEALDASEFDYSLVRGHALLKSGGLSTKVWRETFGLDTLHSLPADSPETERWWRGVVERIATLFAAPPGGVLTARHVEIVRRVRRSGRDVLEIDPGLLEGRLIRMTAGACLRIDKLDLDWSASGGSLQILPGGERTEVSPASGYFLSPVTLAHDPDELGAAVASLPSSKDAVGADRRITIRSSEGHTEVVYEVDEKVDWLPSTCLEYRDNSLLAISFYAWRRTEDLGWYPLAAFRVARKRGPSRSDAPERAEIRASYFRSPGRAGSGQQLVLSIPPKTVIVDAQVEPRRVYHAESVESWPEALRQHAKLLGAALIDEAGDPQAPAPAR